MNQNNEMADQINDSIPSYRQVPQKQDLHEKHKSKDETFKPTLNKNT